MPAASIFTKIDHVGIAVPDLDAAIAFYAEMFGFVSVHEETNEEQGVREAMLRVGDGETQIQLLAPLSEDSTIAKFINRNGPGLQQVAYTVDDIEAASAELRAKGLRLIYRTPRPGTAGSLVNFVHPKDAGGVLVELVQPASNY
ncbi:MAG: methylmalonyl-CoA epimerase [Pseudonocardiales bacterium]|nr:MAG: methylmalonyl-CoA epimerase [Pseudonocardiales bacterium]